MRVAIVIPAFNEAATIGAVVADVKRYGTPVVVDDGSADDTGALASRAGAISLLHPKNGGYDAALVTGLSYAREQGFDVAVTFDADGQHSANTIGEIIELMGNDQVVVVIGIRSRSARPSEALFNLYTRLKFGVTDILCGLKAYRLSALDSDEIEQLHGSVGTAIALDALRRKRRYATVNVPLAHRNGPSSFDLSINANRHILRAMTAQFRMSNGRAVGRGAG